MKNLPSASEIVSQMSPQLRETIMMKSGLIDEIACDIRIFYSEIDKFLSDRNAFWLGRNIFQGSMCQRQSVTGITTVHFELSRDQTETRIKDVEYFGMSLTDNIQEIGLRKGWWSSENISREEVLRSMDTSFLKLLERKDIAQRVVDDLVTFFKKSPQSFRNALSIKFSVNTIHPPVIGSTCSITGIQKVLLSNRKIYDVCYSFGSLVRNQDMLFPKKSKIKGSGDICMLNARLSAMLTSKKATVTEKWTPDGIVFKIKIKKS